MNLAFYAPMKSPDDPTPSGDRQLARLLIRALEEAGHGVTLASRFRSWCADPEGGVQRRLAAAARKEADRVVGHLRTLPARPDLWITYHLYHKAPDWIGPIAADALGIPYIVFEASRAAKRTTGPWAFGFAEADRALARANAVVAMHDDDADGIAAVVDPQRLHRLRPFIDTASYSPSARDDRSADDPPVLITVAMMRAGDKQRSYGILADALNGLRDRAWRHLIAGDGPERRSISGKFDSERTELVGAIAPRDLPELYTRGDIFVWPAVREAFGLVFLEAQAAGLAVVGGRAGGVAEIVMEGETGLLAPEGDATAFREALDCLLGDPERRRSMGNAAADHARRNHDISRAKDDIATILNAAVEHHRQVRA